MALADQKCVPCGKNGQAMTSMQLQQALSELPCWQYVDVSEPKLEREYAFNTFDQALKFANKVGELAEQYNHHPVLIVSWGKVVVQWWTHEIGSVHYADAVLAGKTDRLYHCEVIAT